MRRRKKGYKENVLSYKHQDSNSLNFCITTDSKGDSTSHGFDVTWDSGGRLY